MRTLLKISGVILIIGISGLMYLFYNGSKYGEREWNPQRTHYIQRYQTISFHLMVMPGQGSDYLRGYFCLYNKDGKRLKRSAITNLVFVEPRWTDDEVYFLGMDEDDSVWKLE